MTYELAKELRDAGFPQELPDPSSYFAGKSNRLFGWSEGEDKPYGDYVKCPTLSELIEACGHDFWSLEKGDDGDGENYWLAHLIKSDMDTIGGTGSTPEEAVARLWLALNKQ